MKKILMTIAAAFVAVSMSAQVYLGGNIAFQAWSGEKFNMAHPDQSETVFSIMPEIGYNLSDEWAIGTVIGYSSNKWNGAHESAFTFNPYARYTFANLGKVSLFVDGGVDFTSCTKSDQTNLGIGFKPGLAVSLSDKLSLVSHVGFVGYKLWNPDGDDNNTSMFGLDLDGNNVTFGLYYSF